MLCVDRFSPHLPLGSGSVALQRTTCSVIKYYNTEHVMKLKFILNYVKRVSGFMKRRRLHEVSRVPNLSCCLGCGVAHRQTHTHTAPNESQSEYLQINCSAASSSPLQDGAQSSSLLQSARGC